MVGVPVYVIVIAVVMIKQSDVAARVELEAFGWIRTPCLSSSANDFGPILGQYLNTQSLTIPENFTSLPDIVMTVICGFPIGV